MKEKNCGLRVLGSSNRRHSRHRRCRRKPEGRGLTGGLLGLPQHRRITRAHTYSDDELSCRLSCAATIGPTMSSPTAELMLHYYFVVDSSSLMLSIYLLVPSLLFFTFFFSLLADSFILLHSYVSTAD
jgi:hypothetical protein